MTITERASTAPVQAPAAARAGWRIVRRHSWFCLILTAGLALRALAQTAYRPALLYIDSEKYLEGSVATAPQGYQALLRLLEPAGWRQKAGRAGLAAGCFVLPVLAYLAGTFLVTGHFGMAGNGPSPQYGRAAAATDCATLKVPADQRALCPSPAQTLALGGIDGLLHNPRSPGHTVPVPPGLTRDEFLDRFALATFRQQPLRVAASVARDSVRLFAPVRSNDPQVTPIGRWQFQDFYPTYLPGYSMASLTRLAHAHGSGGDLVAVQPVASWLRAYQLGGGYTPGPLYAAFGVAGVAGVLRRRTELRVPCLFVTLAAAVLLVSSDAFEFSWRYQLPAVVLLPLAGALGVTALIRGRRSRFAAASG